LITDEKILTYLERYLGLKFNEIVNAYYLEKSRHLLRQRGLSEELAGAFIQSVLENISKIPADYIPVSKQLNRFTSPVIVTALLIIVFAFKSPGILTDSAPKFIFSSGEAEFSRYVNISPQDAKVPRGTEVEIRVSGKFHGSPRLFTRTQNISWETPALNYNGTEFVSEKIAVIERTEYFIKWGEQSSRKYVLEPVDPPRIVKMHTKFYFPQYTAKEPAESNNLSDLALPYGTRVDIRAQTNKSVKKASLLFSYNRKAPFAIKGDNAIQGEFIVEREGECWFDLLSNDGMTNLDPARYSIAVLKDVSPDVRVLSPGQNLVVAQDSNVEIVYNVSDDYGLSRLDLVFYPAQEGQKSARQLRLKTISDKKTEITDNYFWKISDINARQGDVIYYYLSAYDNDTVSGPKEGRSDVFSIEIFSYEKEHCEIEKSLYNFREELLNLLAEQTRTRNTLELKLSTTAPISPFDAAKLVENQKNIKTLSQKTSENLKKLLNKMELDPLINYQIYSEHSSMNDSLNYLEKNQMLSAINSLERKDYKTASVNMDEIISTLEKMNLLAEDVMQYQRMQDLLSTGEKLSDLGEQIKNGLQTTPDAQKLSKMKEIMDRIDKLTEEINEILKKMPQQLPEEFINQPSVKQVNTQQLKDTADSLRQALDSGNFEKALEEAKRLMEQLSGMLKTLQEAGGDVGFGGLQKQTSDEVKKGLDELNSIITEQDKIIAQTQEMENIRQQAISQEQEKILKDLAKIQQEAINAALTIPGKAPDPRSGHPSARMGRGTPPQSFKPEISAKINNVIPRMQNVLKEMESKRLIKTREWLKEIIANLDITESFISGYVQNASTEQAIAFIDVSTNTKFVNETEKKILSILESPQDVKFSQNQSERLTGLSEKQTDLKERTMNLDKKVQGLSRKTASITSDISSNLKSASKEMGKASENLTKGNTNEAITSERKALEYLTEGQQSLQNSMQALGQMQSKQNKPMANFIQGKGSGGIMGVRTGYVELPKKEDYIPPKEFREELLNALKEKYPQTYSEIIKKYYRKLTE
ncbi:MAG: DUF4175 family protein, partial [Elusimicrobiota bacterium]